MDLTEDNKKQVLGYLRWKFIILLYKLFFFSLSPSIFSPSLSLSISPSPSLSLSLSLYLSLAHPLYLSLFLLSIYLSLSLLINQYISIYLFILLSIYPSINPSFLSIVFLRRGHSTTDHFPYSLDPSVTMILSHQFVRPLRSLSHLQQDYRLQVFFLHFFTFCKSLLLFEKLCDV